MTDLQVGAKAPEFNFSPVAGTSGETLSVKGIPFVVFFYPRADSPACTSEALSFSEKLADFTALGVRVIGVSPDTPAKLARCKKGWLAWQTSGNTSQRIAFEPRTLVSEAKMLRSIVLWMLGIPIPIIILLWLFLD